MSTKVKCPSCRRIMRDPIEYVDSTSLDQFRTDGVLQWPLPENRCDGLLFECACGCTLEARLDASFCPAPTPEVEQ